MNGLVCPACFERRISPWRVLAMGLFSSVTCGSCGARLGFPRVWSAVWMSLGTVAFWLGVACTFLAVGELQSIWAVFATFVAGGLLGSAPVAIVFLRRVRLVLKERAR